MKAARKDVDKPKQLTSTNLLACIHMQSGRGHRHVHKSSRKSAAGLGKSRQVQASRPRQQILKYRLFNPGAELQSNPDEHSHAYSDNEQSWIPGYWQLGYIPRLRYPGLDTLTMSNPGFQAIGSWARYLSLGTQA